MLSIWQSRLSLHYVCMCLHSCACACIECACACMSCACACITCSCACITCMCPALRVHVPVLRLYVPAIRVHEPALRVPVHALSVHVPALRVHLPAIPAKQAAFVTQNNCIPTSPAAASTDFCYNKQTNTSQDFTSSRNLGFIKSFYIFYSVFIFKTNVTGLRDESAHACL